MECSTPCAEGGAAVGEIANAARCELSRSANCCCCDAVRLGLMLYEGVGCDSGIAAFSSEGSCVEMAALGVERHCDESDVAKFLR